MITLFLTSFVLSVLLAFLVLKFFPIFGLMDKPKKYGLNRAPVPYSVGFVFFILFVVLVFWKLPFEGNLLWVFCGGAIVVLVSVLDDFFNLSPFVRLFVQFIASLFVVFAGVKIHSFPNPFGEPFSLDILISNFASFEVVWLSLIFTIFWIVVLMNTLNWLDGINGLASGVGFIGSMVIYFLSSIETIHIIDQYPVSVMSAILAGILLTLAIFEFNRPKFLIGDSGSMFIGFILAVLSVYSGGKIATAFLILGFPIIDFFIVIIRRLWNGKSPFKGKDGLHLHDQLLSAGYSKKVITVLIYLLSLAFGIGALALQTTGKFILFGVAFILMISIQIYLGNPRKSKE